MTHKSKKAFSFTLVLLSSLLIFIFVLFLSFLYLRRRSTTHNPQPTTYIHIPEPNESPTENGLAVPLASFKTLPGAESKVRTFEITAQKNAFSSQKIIVGEGDIVKIRFTALDNQYDLFFPALGVKTQAKKGETKFIEFQAVSSGSFEFLCETCGPKTKGTLLVAART